MKKLQSERILKAKQLRAIGSVAVECSRLEYLLEILIWLICDFDQDRGRIFTSRLQLDGRLQLLKSLLKEKPKSKEFTARFNSISEDISDVIPKRNTIIHGDWLGVPKSLRKEPAAKASYPVAIRLKAGQENIPPVHGDEVANVAKTLSDLHERLMRLWLDHWGEIVPSPSKEKSKNRVAK